MTRTAPWSKTILGQPYSKANSRRIVEVAGKIRSIKSKSALSYSQTFLMQCPILDPLFTDDLHIDIDIYYSNRKPDLDESLILDLLQGRVYKNDRQIKSKYIRWHLDKENPRSVISIRLLEDQ